MAYNNSSSLNYTLPAPMIQDNVTGVMGEEVVGGAKKMDVFVIINILLAVLIIMVNAFVAFLFYYKRALLGKPSNKLLLSLSICDLLSGLGVGLHVFVTVSPIFDVEECHACLVIRISIDIFTTFLIEAAVIHLCMITADRFLSLFFALRYRDLVTRSTITRFISVAWLLPFLTSAVQVTYLYPLFRTTPEATDEEYDQIDKIEMWYSMVSFGVYMLIPFLLNGIAFISMFLEIRKLLLKTPSRRLRQTSGVSSQQRRVIYIFSMMYVCFVALIIPYFTLRLFLDMGYDIDVNPIVLNVFYTCKTLTSLCNPILYSAMNREFRSIAGLWVKKRKEEISSTVQKLSVNPVYLATKRRSIRSSISEQGSRTRYDSGIYEGQTMDTVTCNLMTPRSSLTSEAKQDDSIILESAM